MNLCFTGRGSMLNPEEGNNCAYFETDNSIYLIDCGEDVTRKLISSNKLKNEKEVYLFCTHTHSDHIGSIGTLITYLYYVCGKILKIVYDDNVDYLEQMQSILDSTNNYPYQYEFLSTDILKPTNVFDSVKYIKTNHGDPNIKSCALIFDTKDGKVLYTGDIKDEKVITDFINENSYEQIDKIYVDTSMEEIPVHLSFSKLKEIIPDNLKNKVYCMHFDNIELLPKIKKQGFHFVTKVNDLNKIDIEEILSCYKINKEGMKIISGAALVLQDIKETTHDIDVAVTPEVLEEILQNYNCIYEKNINGSDIYMLDDVINFSTNFYNTVETKKINDFNVQTPESIKVLKKSLNRKKDQYDIYLIDKKTGE